ncbi:MAG: M23 family metallopeptidase [Sandaracinaceae bacterium]
MRIPILREQVRATRARHLSIAVGGLVLLVTGVAALLLAPGLYRRVVDPGATPAAAATVDPQASPLDPARPVAPSRPEGRGEPTRGPARVDPRVERAAGDDGHRSAGRTVHLFGDARGFRPAVVAAGCTEDEADAVVAALEGVLDFRRCRPGHELVVERDDDGQLLRFAYLAGPSSIVEAVRDDEGALQGRRVQIPVERTRIARGGVVRSSLGNAFEDVGLGRSLVGMFVEVFERRVNFTTDTRAGDTFRIVVDEERVAGEPHGYGQVYALAYHGQRTGLLEAFWYPGGRGVTDFYFPEGRAVHGSWLRTPLHYDHVSSPFNPRRMHPILRRIVPHNGIDYAASSGTPVWAAADGTVTFVGPRGANGNLVSLRHARGFETHYAHLLRFASGLRRGVEVRQRQVIGFVGSTGRSTGPHLHFGLKRRGRFIDPASELNAPGQPLPPAHRGPFRRRMQSLRAELAEIELDEPEPTGDGSSEPLAQAPPADEAMD